MKKEKIQIQNIEDIKLLPKEEQLKYEIAQELGFFDQIIEKGWSSLTSQESGKIGGILARRKK